MKTKHLLFRTGTLPRGRQAALAGLLLATLTVASMSQAQAQAQAEPESGRVTVAVGEVAVIAPGQADPQPLAAGDMVAVGSMVRTGANSRAVIVMTPRSAIRVAADSELLIELVDEAAERPRVTLDLKDGSLGALLKPGEGEEIDFQIRTPSGIAAARGTYFAVVVEDGVGYTQVKEGRVEVIPEQEDNNDQPAPGDAAPVEAPVDPN